MLDKVCEEASQVVAGLEDEWVGRRGQVLLNHAQVEVMREGVHVGQVLELVTLVSEDVSKLHTSKKGRGGGGGGGW